MRVLMLGWERSTRTYGGIGQVRARLATALSAMPDTHVTLLMLEAPVEAEPEQLTDSEQPRKPVMESASAATSSIHAASSIHAGSSIHAASSLTPYERPLGLPNQPVAARFASSAPPIAQLRDDLFSRVNAYAKQVIAEVRGVPFDVIHAHEWMSFPAAMELRDAFGKPMVLHVHSTELGRAGVAADARIVQIERRSLAAADAIIVVSHLTARVLERSYGIAPEKIHVIHSAIAEPTNGQSTESAGAPDAGFGRSIGSDEQVVLFAGRMTLQKGPEYFLAAARIVASMESNVRFVLAGEGGLSARMMAVAVELGIADRVTFAGYVEHDDMMRLFRQADVFVMPSVSEPYGLAALEAVGSDVPVLLSRQCGVGEVSRNAMRADFWDVRDMAAKIVSMLRYPPLSIALRRRAAVELRQPSWVSVAQRCRALYQKVIDRLALTNQPHAVKS